MTDNRLGASKGGEWILASFASLDRDIEIVRNRISYLERRKARMKKVFKVLVLAVIAVSLILIVRLCHAEITEASYYTYASCLKEGTSGICANGERLKDYGEYTCASWQYDFGTLLRVTNLSNNRSIIARVNDRGPAKRLYRKGRKLDLNFAAMDALGGIKSGLIQVDVRRIK